MENDMSLEQDISSPMDELAVEQTPAEATAPAAPDVAADTVNITGNANVVNAQMVTCTNGAIGAVKSETLTMHVENGAVGGVQAQHVVLSTENSAVGGVLAQDVTVNQGQLVFVLAKNISGSGRILFDVKAGLLAGVACGLVVSAFKLIAGRRK